MKATMKILTLLAAILLMTACSKDDDEDARPQSPVIGTWKAFEYLKEYQHEFESTEFFEWQGKSNELVINRNGTFRCGAYPHQPETSGYYKIDDDRIKFYTDPQMLKPDFGCIILDLHADTLWLRFHTYDSKDYFYEVRLKRLR